MGMAECQHDLIDGLRDRCVICGADGLKIADDRRSKFRRAQEDAWCEALKNAQLPEWTDA